MTNRLPNEPTPLKGTPGHVSEIKIRPAQERDYGAISHIQYRCPETAQWPLGDYSGYPLLLALVGDKPAGFCSWRQAAPDEAEILNIAVHPDYRRRGIGAALLERVCEEARGAVFLEVAETNAAALALYRKQGWADAGVRQGYYSQGTVDAVVMKKCSW